MHRTSLVSASDLCLIDIHDLAFDTTGDLRTGEGLDVGGLEAGDALGGLEE